MKNGRLIQILRSCSKKELRELRKWVQSPAHNQRKDVIQLFDYLIEDDHLYKEEFLDKAQVYKWVHSKTRYDDAKMRQTIYFFMKSLEDFLVFQELLENEIQTKVALARVYRKRKLDKPFQKNIRIAQGLQEKQHFRNGRFLQNKYLLEQEVYNYLSTFKSRDINLQQMSDASDITFIADKLRQSCLMLANQTLYKADYQIGLQDEVLSFVESNAFLLEIPAIALYYYGYNTITNKHDESHFQNLKTQINLQGHLFPKTEFRDIYLMAINYCIGRINAGLDPFIREAFELYRKGFENKVFIEQKLVSRSTFLNVVSIALKLKEFTWVETFIEEYQQYVDAKLRESCVNYSWALFFYEKRDYTTSMTYLVQYEHDEIVINLRAKNVLIKIYYEQKEFNALESLLESMRNYLVRKKVMGYHKSNFKNIIRLTKKLLKTNPYSKSQKLKLKTEIENANPLTGDERSWFLEQVERL